MNQTIIDRRDKPVERAAVERRTGRPRSFSRARALDIALHMFLSRGYLSSSVTELTGAMGISRPSLYAAFGSKESLFRQALELHAERHLDLLKDALAEPTARDMVRRLLRASAEDPAFAGGVGGFTGLLSSLPGDPDLQPVRDVILSHHGAVMEALGARLAMAQRENQVSQDLHPEGIAFVLEALTHGIAVRVLGGMPQGECEGLIEEALTVIEKGSRAA